MSDEIRFSEFPETKEMKQESVIPIVQSGKNMKIAFENFAKWIGISEEKIAQAVEAYLKENSLETGATQEQVAQINENTLAIDRLYKAVSEKEDAGTAESKVSSHNTSTDSHNDIRLLLQNTINTLNAFLNADEETLNQASEMIAYMKDNRGLIEQVTTNKVSVSDIVDNYTTNVSNKPVSAAVAVKLKTLIDAIIVPTQLAQLAGDATHRTVTDAEKQSWNNKADKTTTLSGYGITDGATKKEVDQLSKEMEELTKELENLEKPTDKQVTSAVNLWLEEHTDAIGDGEEKNNLLGKNWLAFGDSITGLGYNYATIISKLKGCNLHRSYRGGQTLSYAHGENSAIYQFTAENPTNGTFVYEDGYKPDFITIMYGVNDGASEIGSLSEDGGVQTEDSYSFIGCYCGLIRAIIAKWGYVPIYLITPPQTSNWSTKLEELAQATIDVARHFGLPVYDYFHESQMMKNLGDTELTVDGTHTSQKGSEIFAGRLFKFLNEHEGTLTTNPYTITYNLTNVKLNGYALPVDSGERYYGESIYASSDDYIIDTVTVTMGGVDITETAYDSSTGRVAIESVTGNVVVTAIATLDESYRAIEYNLDNVVSSNTSASVAYNGSYTAKLSSDNGYVIDNVIVTMGGVDVTASAYSNGTITIANVTGNVVITASATYTVYTVTNTLTNAINSNTSIGAVHGSSYSANISAEIGYDLSSVTVTMNGEDITESAYSDGTITIANVTGNVVITAISTENAIQPVYELYNHHLDGTNGFEVECDVFDMFANDFTILCAVKNYNTDVGNAFVTGCYASSAMASVSYSPKNCILSSFRGKNYENFGYLCASWDATAQTLTRRCYSGNAWTTKENQTGNAYSNLENYKYNIHIGQNYAYNYDTGNTEFSQSAFVGDISLVIYDTKDISSNIMKTFVDSYAGL